ncbi:hypothetical protein M1116_03405 [Patescibacteria group bacterium]|nr:hypothetical protein [Patescibacteria group bacterium]
MFKRKIIKTGNSLCVTIPFRVASDLDIKEGDIALLRVNKSHSRVTYLFPGHPKQLSLIESDKKH